MWNELWLDVRPFKANRMNLNDVNVKWNCHLFRVFHCNCNTWYHSTFGSKFLAHFVPHHEVRLLNVCCSLFAWNPILFISLHTVNFPGALCLLANLAIHLPFPAWFRFCWMFCRCHNHHIYHNGKNICQKQTEFSLFAFEKNKNYNKIHITLPCPMHWIVENTVAARIVRLISGAFYFGWEATYVTMFNWNCISHRCCCIVIRECRIQDEIIIHIFSVAFGTDMPNYMLCCVWWIQLHSMTCLFLHQLLDTTWLHFRRKLKRWVYLSRGRCLMRFTCDSTENGNFLCRIAKPN